MLDNALLSILNRSCDNTMLKPWFNTQGKLSTRL